MFILSPTLTRSHQHSGQMTHSVMTPAIMRTSEASVEGWPWLCGRKWVNPTFAFYSLCHSQLQPSHHLLNPVPAPYLGVLDPYYLASQFLQPRLLPLVASHLHPAVLISASFWSHTALCLRAFAPAVSLEHSSPLLLQTPAHLSGHRSDVAFSNPWGHSCTHQQCPTLSPLLVLLWLSSHKCKPLAGQTAGIRRN